MSVPQTEAPYGQARIGLVEPGPGEVDAQVLDVWREGQLAGRRADSYQGVPPVKKAPWEWYYIPVYFWVGGIAAGSWLAAAAEDVAGASDRGVVRAGRYIALTGTMAGAGLLIADLGRPERFLNMLRIVRARSPMSLGAWGLSAFGTLTGIGAALQFVEDALGARSRLGRLSSGWLGRAVHLAGVPLALFIGGYTGVLLAATSTPVWAQRKLLLGPLFLTSGVASGLAAVSFAVNAADSASPAARRRLSRAAALALGAELLLESADREEARKLPSSRRGSPLVKTMRALMVGAGMIAPLALELVRGIAPVGKERRRRERERWEQRRARGRRRRSRQGLLVAGLTLAGGLALRLLTAHEGKISADTPEDTWAFAAPRPVPSPRAGAGAPPQPAGTARAWAGESAELRAGASSSSTRPARRGRAEDEETAAGGARGEEGKTRGEQRAAD
jgi:formate-dependent nitrite reductase membrane component NrfD